jgi:LemA protein
MRLTKKSFSSILRTQEHSISRLKASEIKYKNESFLKLQDSLEGTENRIAVERKRYNDAVKTLNAYRRTFFGRFFAAWVGVEAAEYYEIPEAEAETPQVKF